MVSILWTTIQSGCKIHMWEHHLAGSFLKGSDAFPSFLLAVGKSRSDQQGSRFKEDLGEINGVLGEISGVLGEISEVPADLGKLTLYFTSKLWTLSFPSVGSLAMQAIAGRRTNNRLNIFFSQGVSPFCRKIYVFEWFVWTLTIWSSTICTICQILATSQACSPMEASVSSSSSRWGFPGTAKCNTVRGNLKPLRISGTPYLEVVRVLREWTLKFLE